MFPDISEIKKRRKNLNLTQKQLATLAGVSQSMIAKTELGRAHPSYITVKKIFETLQSIEEGTQMKAKDIVSSNIVYVKENDTVGTAMRLMEEHGYSQLPVFNGEQVVGSIDERVILNTILEGKSPSKILNESVELVMDEPFPRISEETPITVVSILLRYNQAVLVTKKDRCVGIITKTDLFKIISE